MTSIKRFEEFVSEMDRSEEIEKDLVSKGTPEVKSDKETETVIKDKNFISEAGEANIGTNAEKEENTPVSEMLKKCYDYAQIEAKTWSEDAHDEHTVETYMAENASLVAGLAADCLNELKSDMETEAYEACLNKMSESFTKKINECKEMKDAIDVEDV